MGKHTPGPWEVRLSMGSQSIAYDISSDDGRVCSSPRWATPREDEALANARLIAAAPDLLEALEAIMHAHQADIEFDPDPDSPAHDAWDMADAAISKAKGE